MPELDWFRSFAEVPGVEWEPSEKVSVGPPLTTAEPVVERSELDPSLVWVSWVGGDGEPLPGEYGFKSPAEGTSYGVWEAESTAEISRLVATGLSLPGTRQDYFSVIERGMGALGTVRDEDPDRVRLQERLARLAISLIELGLEEAVAPPFTNQEESNRLALAARPYSTLYGLYMREGFLQEAAAVYAEVQKLPKEVRDQAYMEPGPDETLEAIEEVLADRGVSDA